MKGSCIETLNNGKTNLYTSKETMNHIPYNTYLIEITKAVNNLNNMNKTQFYNSDKEIKKIEEEKIKHSWEEANK
jgi:hypothetical protein